MGAPYKIMIVDDHPVVRNGLSLILTREADFQVCAEAASAQEAVRGIEEHNPDLILLDISLGGVNGIELTKSLRDAHPEIAVLVLSIHDEGLYAERALRAGAKGYLMKNEAPNVILDAVRKVLNGGLHVSENLTTKMLQEMVDGKQKSDHRKGVEMLTDRELEIFELIGKAMGTREISDKLGISVKTVEAHRAHIKEKLKIRTAAALSRFAIRWVEGAGSKV